MSLYSFVATLLYIYVNKKLRRRATVGAGNVGATCANVLGF